MTGPEHYKAAENLLTGTGSPHATDEGVRRALAEAQVHATLALAAATALASATPYERECWNGAAASYDQNPITIPVSHMGGF